MAGAARPSTDSLVSSINAILRLLYGQFSYLLTPADILFAVGCVVLMMVGVLGQHPVCMRCNEAAITDCEASPADKLVERQTVIVVEPPRPHFNDLALPEPVVIQVHLSGTQQTRRFSVGDAAEIVGTLQCSSKDKQNRVQVFIDCHYAQTKSLTETHVNRQIIHEALASHPQVSQA